MGDAFKKTVLHILHTKQRAEDEEREEGQGRVQMDEDTPWAPDPWRDKG